MTIAVAVTGFVFGAIIGDLRRLGQDRGRPHPPHGRGRLHHRAARHSRSARHLSVLFRRQRARSRRSARLFGAERLHRPSRLPGRRACGRHHLGRLSDRSVSRRLQGRLTGRDRGGASPAACRRALRFRRIIAPLVLRYALPGPRQCLAARAEGIRARFGHRPCRDCCARRRSAPVRRGQPFTFYHRGGAALSGDLDRLRLGAAARRAAASSRGVQEGADGFHLPLSRRCSRCCRLFR